MTINIIAAMDSNRVIGNSGALPWGRKMSADLKHFKEITANHTVLMGRKTYESIGRRLPDRRNIVISSRSDLIASGCLVVPSFEAAMENVFPSEIVFCIGGSRVFQVALPLAEKMYLTEIDADIGGDTFFSEFDKNDWKEVSREHHEPDEKNQYPYDFVLYERK